jgi:hypothetical protein
MRREDSYSVGSLRKSLGLALSKGPNRISVFPPNLRTETHPVSETLCFLVSRIPSISKQLMMLVSVISEFKSSDFHLRVSLKDKVRVKSSEELRKASGMNFLMFPQGSLCLGTYSDDTRHIYRQRVITSRLFHKTRKGKLQRKNGS